MGCGNKRTTEIYTKLRLPKELNMAGLIKSLNVLNPEFKKLVDLFLTKLDEAKIRYFINETLRTIEVQRAYYAQGRQPLIEVNALRKLAGLWQITDVENRRKITWTMKSKHLEGLAIDIVPLNPTTKRLWWEAPDYIWKEIADVSKDCGLEPGYYWDIKDSPHHQMPEK